MFVDEKTLIKNLVDKIVIVKLLADAMYRCTDMYFAAVEADGD